MLRRVPQRTMAEPPCAAADDPWSRPLSLGWTFCLLVAGLALCVFCLWHQRRPRDLGDVPWFPSTLMLGVGLVVTLVALAHIVSLLTGIELRGRSGF
jgi:hypothetical protein